VIKIRILFLGVLPFCTTAYGKNAFNICTRLKERGHKIIIFPNTSLFHINRPFRWRGMRIVGRRDLREFTINELRTVFEKYNSDIIFQHFDIWAWESVFLKCDMPFVSYTPVDTSAEPPKAKLTETLVNICKNANMNLAMSKYGYECFKNAGLPTHHAPHGVDEKMYYPEDKMEARKKIHLNTDKFVFGIVSINRPRKNVMNQMRAYKMFLDNNPKADTMLYLHTFPMRQFNTGFNLITVAKNLNIPVDKIAFTHPYSFKNAIEPDMRHLYNSFDCYLNVTLGEGFGLAILEAMACGIPSLVTDFGAMKELSNFRVKVKEWFSGSVDSFFAVPDTEHMVGQMEKIYNSDKLREKYKKEGLKKAKELTWDKSVVKIEKGLMEAIE